MVVDIRSSITAAALNAGIVTKNDLDEVADSYFTFTTDDDVPIIPMYDPKFQSMSPLYLDSTDAVVQRLGNYCFNVTFDGILYAETKVLSADPNPSMTCPLYCDSYEKFCSAPAFQFEFTPPTSGVISNLNAVNSNPLMFLGLVAYSNELYVLNEAKMDPGMIGCKSTQTGSNQYLGKLAPVSSANFLAALQSIKPFKLAENYFFCYPEKLGVFVNSIGIANGNTSLLFSVVMGLVVFMLGSAKLIPSTVTGRELDATVVLFAEILKIKAAGGKMTKEQKALLATLRLALQDGDGDDNAFADSTSEGAPLNEKVVELELVYSERSRL